jgi:sugar phosphate isomerase/epimerase
MKLAFSSLAAPDQPLAEFLKQVAAAGYDGVELRGKDRKHLDPAMSAAERAEVRRLLADTCLEAAAVTSYVVLAPDSADRAKAEATLAAYIDLARDVGSPLLRVFGGRIPQGEDRGAVERRMADVLLAVAGRAAAASVDLCVETHDEFTRAEDLARVLMLARHPNVCALWDVNNQFESGEPVARGMELLYDELGYLHIKDSFPLGGDKRQLCFLGAGDVPIAQVVQMLKARDFGGYLVVEWEKAWHPDLPPADVAMVQHILKLREYAGAGV